MASDLTVGKVKLTAANTDPTGGWTGNSQLLIGSGDRQVAIARDTDGDNAYITSYEDSVGYKNLVLQGVGGNVGIGCTPSYPLAVEADGVKCQLRETNAAKSATVSFVNSGSTASYNDVAAIEAGIDSGAAKGFLSFGTRQADASGATVEAMRIDSTGLATFANGIAVSGGAAGTLDAYGEGTYTPTLLGGTTDPTVSYAIQAGVYTRIGNLVTVRFSVGTSANTGGAGDIRIGGLPFTSKNSSNHRTITGISAYNFDADAATFQLSATGVHNTTYFTLNESKDSATWSTPTWAQATNAAVYFNGTVTYWI